MTAPGSAQREFYPALHTLRGIAALWVVLFHVWFFAGEPQLALSLDQGFKVGWLGVHLFYALSAFLLGGYLLDRPNANLRQFMWRRFLRIFPAYYSQLLALILAAPLIGLALPTDVWSWLGHLVMAFHLPPQYVQPINGVWWTLPIEFAFYLLLPTLLWLFRRVGSLGFFALCLVITLAYRGWLFAVLQDAPVGVIASRIEQLPGVLTVFAAGLIAARVVRRRELSPWLPAWSLAGMALWIALLLATLDRYWQGGVMLYLFGTVNAAFMAALIGGLFHHRGALAGRVGVWLGEVSYGIYLWHLPVILGLVHHGMTLTFWPLLGATLIPTLVLAWLSLRVVELPAMRLGRSTKRPSRV